MVRRRTVFSLILIISCLGFASTTRAQMADSYRQAAQAYRNAASQCSGAQQACYMTWANYYDCIASTFQSGSRVTCQKPAQTCSSGGSATGANGQTGTTGTTTGNASSDPVLNLLSSLPPPKTTGELAGRMGLGMGLEVLSLFAKHHHSSASGDTSGSADGTSDAGGGSQPSLQQQLDDQEGQALQAMNAADQQQSLQQYQQSLRQALEPDAQAAAEQALTANSEPAPEAPPDPSQQLLSEASADSAPSGIPDASQVPAMEQSVAQQAGPEWTQALNSVQGQQETSPASTNQLITGSWQQMAQTSSSQSAPSDFPAAASDPPVSSWHNPFADALPEGLMLTAQRSASEFVGGVETTIGGALSNLPIHMAIAKGADMLLDAKDETVCAGESDGMVHANCMIDQAGQEVGHGLATRIFAIHRQFYENIFIPGVNRIMQPTE